MKTVSATLNIKMNYSESFDDMDSNGDIEISDNSLIREIALEYIKEDVLRMINEDTNVDKYVSVNIDEEIMSIFPDENQKNIINKEYKMAIENYYVVEKVEFLSNSRVKTTLLFEDGTRFSAIYKEPRTFATCEKLEKLKAL